MLRANIYATVVISIVGIAYPILWDIISKLDNKYCSIKIIEIFENEPALKNFKKILCLDLIIMILWSLCTLWPDEISYKVLNELLDFYLVSYTIIFLIYFFILVRKSLEYSIPSKCVSYLSSKFSVNRQEYKILEALSDIAVQSIRRENLGICEMLSEFFCSEFNIERRNKTNGRANYPRAFYSLNYQIVKEIASQKGNRNHHFLGAVSGSWLRGYEENTISEETYRWLWSNLFVEVEYNQNGMIMAYWKDASQYYDLFLKEIYAEYQPDSPTPENMKEIDRRKSERKTFLEFNYALGGLLLYKKRYSSVFEIFNYTQSKPPKYPLLPESMEEIFTSFIKFGDPTGGFDMLMFKYPYQIDIGLGEEKIIKRWICTYMALLFVRQFLVRQWWLPSSNPLDEPPIPKSQREKAGLIDNLDYFRILVKRVLEDSELMVNLNYHFLTDEWFKKEGKKHPLVWIDDFKNELQKRYDEDEKSLKLDPAKIQQFFDSSKSIVEAKLNLLKAMSGQYKPSEEYNTMYIDCNRLNLFKKDWLSLKPETDVEGFDTILANIVCDNIDSVVSNSFSINAKQTYLIKDEDIFEAISKLGVDQNYLIVCFGIQVQHYIERLKIKNLKENSYNGIPIIFYKDIPLCQQAIYIVKREDLPVIRLQEINKATIDKYHLEKISAEYELYASILDLNNFYDIRKELMGTETEDNIKRSAIVALILSPEIKWKKSVNMVKIKVFSTFISDRPPDNLSKVKRLI